jgi:predicted transposase YdaD
VWGGERGCCGGVPEARNKKKKGMQQGLVQGRQEILCKMLENGLAPEQVADITGVGMDEIQNMME